MYQPRMHEIDVRFRNRFARDTERLLRRRVQVVLSIGIVLIPLFSFMDLMVAPEMWRSFLFYRLLCSVILLGLLVYYYFSTGLKSPVVMLYLMCFIASGTISIMVVSMGGYETMYYLGIILVLVTCLALMPLNTRQAAWMGFMTYLVYVVPVLVYCTPPAGGVKHFYAGNFFFLSYLLVTVLQCREETRARIREFKLKMELEFYNNFLEDEVENRARDLEVSELRYRELYDNIIDMVVLVDKDSNVLMANPRFYSIIGMSESAGESLNLMNYIHPDDVSVFKVNVLERISRESDISGIEFRLSSIDGNLYHVECNARMIKNKGCFLGVQMVVRDITERKQLEEDLIESYSNLEKARESAILGLAKLAEYRDNETGLHLERMREYARLLVEEMAQNPKYKGYITKRYIDDIYNSAILHDIGKVGVPDAILKKKSKLEKHEFDFLKHHTRIGGDAIGAVESRVGGVSFLTLGKTIAYYHHEKWDGSGYMEGLSGDDIPLSTRVVALADVYDALTSERVYKEAYSHEKAREMIVGERGKHFDPDVVDAFLVRENQFDDIRSRMQVTLH